jgi:hypothetical protein
MNIFDSFPKFPRLKRQKKGNENESWPSVGGVFLLLWLWPVSFWLTLAIIIIFLSIGAHFLQFRWRKVLKSFLAPISFDMLSGWGMLGVVIGTLIAGIWFRPPPIILGMSIGTIIGFLAGRRDISPVERIGWVLFTAIGGMLLPTFILDVDIMMPGLVIGVRAFTLIGVLGQGAYELFSNWTLLTEASGSLQDVT